MVNVEVKQRMKAKIDEMSIEELSEIAEYTFNALRNIKDQVPMEKVEKGQKGDALYPLFEKELGRLLSPMEIETLNMWIDQDKYDETLIKHGLREAVISGKLNIKYIDRILLNWKRNGVKSVEQAREYSKNFKGSAEKPKITERELDNNTPRYNWLKG